LINIHIKLCVREQGEVDMAKTRNKGLRLSRQNANKIQGDAYPHISAIVELGKAHSPNPKQHVILDAGLFQQAQDERRKIPQQPGQKHQRRLRAARIDAARKSVAAKGSRVGSDAHFSADNPFSYARVTSPLKGEFSGGDYAVDLPGVEAAPGKKDKSSKRPLSYAAVMLGQDEPDMKATRVAAEFKASELGVSSLHAGKVDSKGKVVLAPRIFNPPPVKTPEPGRSYAAATSLSPPLFS
jgi:hypothetical protein